MGLLNNNFYKPTENQFLNNFSTNLANTKNKFDENSKFKFIICNFFKIKIIKVYLKMLENL